MAEYIERRKAEAMAAAAGQQSTLQGTGLVITGGDASKTDVADELAKLAALRDRGVLTDAEFEAQKARLLAR
jgi:putative oligomerization/nucleic acid binding protein